MTALADIWQRHAGKPIAILGSGWSLERTLPYSMPYHRVGLSRSWRYCFSDYWVCLRDDAADDAVEGPGSAHFLASPVRVVTASVRDSIGHRESDLVICAGRIDERVGLLHRESVSLEFCKTGRYPGQQLGSRNEPSPGTLWRENSGTDSAIHFALMLGASELHLYGVDLCNEPETHRRRFCDQPPVSAEQLEDARFGAAQLGMNRRNLEKVAVVWRDAVRLVCHSPAANLDGWENPKCTAET